MPEQAPHRCPQCSGPLQIASLSCPACDLEITGQFARCRFCDLPPEQLAFLEVFVRCRGVIRKMEQELGISYPTVRSRVDALLRALGLDEEQHARNSIRDVLEMLDEGEITADEAIGRIGEIRGREP